MKGLKMMGLTLAASSIAFSLSQVAHAEQMVNGDNQVSSYNHQSTLAQDGYVLMEMQDKMLHILQIKVLLMLWIMGN